MRFGRSPEQVAFGETIGRVLVKADLPTVIRRWAAGDRQPGLELWAQLAAQGVTALRVGEEYGGLAASWVDLVVAFEQLGYHAVPGPWIETVAVAPTLLSASGDADALTAIAAGTGRVSLGAPPVTLYAVDVEVADGLYLLEGSTLYRATPTRGLTSVDPARHLSELAPAEPVAEVAPPVATAALDGGALACAAQLLGAAQRMLADSVAYAKSRKQFGRAIGEFQSIKHMLADVRIAVDFLRPLVHGAAVALDGGSPDASRDVSAAKVFANQAATLAARTALQVHGAIGYTAEFDLSLVFTRVRALTSAWGTSSWHRARVLAALRPET